MNSRSGRMPFCLPSSSSSYTSSPAVSSSLSSSRLYCRERALNKDSFPRATSYKTDGNQQSPRLLGLSRDCSSSTSCSTSRSTSWKLPSSLTSSSRSSEASLSSRSKLTDSGGRTGMPSLLLSTTDDGDSKRAKLSHSNRGQYSRVPSTSFTGSTCASSGLSSGRGTGENQKDSSWNSHHLLSRSASSSPKSLLPRRQLDPKEPSPSGLGERRIRPPELTSPLHQTDRLTSTYAQGARPKQTAYSPSSSSYSSTSRESVLNSHLSSSSCHRPSPLLRDFSSRSTTHFSNGSSTRNSSREQGRLASSTDVSSSCSSQIPLYKPLPRRAEATLPPRPGPEDGGPESRSSTRRLLSRLFSRRSSQDSSSGCSSNRSFDDDSPSTGGGSVDNDEGTSTSSVESDSGDSEAALGFLRSRRPVLAPIQENHHHEYRGLPQSRMPSWREPGISSGSGSSSPSLCSSPPSRCPPLLSHVRDQRTHPIRGSDGGYSHTRYLPRRWKNPEQRASDDDDDEEEEKEDRAVGLEARGASCPSKPAVESSPELEGASAEFTQRRHDNTSASVEPPSGVENLLHGLREKPVASSDQEKLRKIKERLLMEDSDEDEGDLCRICQMGENSALNPLIQPCRCTGSLQYVHQECIKRWLCSKIDSGTSLEAIVRCELCKGKLKLNDDNFDIQELYRTRVQCEYEFLNNGQYLVALLNFCVHFTDVLGGIDRTVLFSPDRIFHGHVDNLEIPNSESEESEEAAGDDRPSIDFSDLDDDFEED